MISFILPKLIRSIALNGMVPLSWPGQRLRPLVLLNDRKARTLCSKANLPKLDPRAVRAGVLLVISVIYNTAGSKSGEGNVSPLRRISLI